MGEGYLPGILEGVTATAQMRATNLLCFVGGALNGLPGIAFHSQRNILYTIPSVDNLDGLIIISSLGNYGADEHFRNLYAHYDPLPAVSIGAPINGALNVTVDNQKGLRDALAHLIEVHNHQRIAFIQGPAGSMDAQIRYQIYTETLASYQLPLDPALVAPGFFNFSSGAEAIRLLVDQRQVAFEAVMAANDHMALGALAELQSRGMIVPYDLAVVGFDDIKQARHVAPPLTTVRQPLFELGSQALDTLLARIANETVPEQIILPAELVVRRSCGCQEAVAVPLAPRPVTASAETFAQNLHRQRRVIMADLNTALDFSPLTAPEAAKQLLHAFSDEILNNNEGFFLSTLDRFLRLVMQEGGDVLAWQTVVTVLRRHTLSGLPPDELSRQAEALLYQVQLFITAQARESEIQQRLYIERQNWMLHEIGQLLITMFDLEKLLDILVDNMPRLGIPGCYLVLYEAPRPYKYPQPPPEWSWVVLACNVYGRVPLAPYRQRFPTRLLLPEGILPEERRYTILIESLYFREEQIGYVLFERGPKEGTVYEMLRGQIASALKAALLVQAHKRAEEELRQHRDQLDELVQERTAELATANAHLRQEIEEHRQAEQELQESQRNLAYAQKVAQLGYYYWDLHSGKIFWSDEMYRIFGVDKANFTPTADNFAQFLHPDDLHVLSQESFARATEQETHQMEFRIIEPVNSALKHLYLWGETIFDASGLPLNIFGIIQDVTVQRQAELQLEAHAAELERSNRELQAFAYVASHDLQEPLRKIQAFGDRLQQKYRPHLDERGQDYIDRMQNAASRMQALIIDLLAFSRVRTHAQPFRKVNLNQVIQGVRQDLEIAIAEAGAHFEVAELPVIDADTLQMQQLFQNLLSNALKFHRPDVPLRVKIYNRMVDKFCEIIIVDNGIGFNEQYANRIFNVFERLHNREAYPGTGVGLAICRRIVERHDGYIRAQSQLGEGATFIVGLPMNHQGQPANTLHSPPGENFAKLPG